MQTKITHLTSVHPRYDTRIFIKICSSLATSENYKLIFEEYKDKMYDYTMYDTFFGRVSEGLKMFKIKLGYKPYRVK